jgi:tRNA pseudouridine13 synthase
MLGDETYSMNTPTELQVPEWPYALGCPVASAMLRVKPEDFEVEELPAIEPSGEGSHLWLWIEKTQANTDWVATQLAKARGCSPRDVGFAGMKDRHAVTRQWYSMPCVPGSVDKFTDPGIEGVRILKTSLHEKKLRRGVLQGNRFRILLRDLDGDTSSLEDRLNFIAARGVPNYFGQQRFGFGGSNVQRAVQWLEQGGRLPRAKRSIYLSALRSFLFNHVLAKRLENDCWDSLMDGDLAMLDGTHSIFLCDEIDPTLQQRCENFDIHPTGPLPGKAGMGPAGAAAELETKALLPFAPLIEKLNRFGVDSERRSLRLRVRNFQWEFQPDGLQLDFSLPAGAYATVVIRELVQVEG